MFCGGLCEFLIHARYKLRGLLVRGLEPRSRKSGTRKFLGGSDRSPKTTKWQGIKLLAFFVPCLCQLGGTEMRCEEETGSQMCAPIYLNIYFSETNKQKKRPHKTQHTSSGSWQSPISANEWIVLALFNLKPSLRVQSCLLHKSHKSFLSYTQKFALW